MEISFDHPATCRLRCICGKQQN